MKIVQLLDFLLWHFEDYWDVPNIIDKEYIWMLIYYKVKEFKMSSREYFIPYPIFSNTLM